MIKGADIIFLLHRHLHMGAWFGGGPSPTNKIFAGLIALSCLWAILLTEPVMASFLSKAPWVELIFQIIFSIEYILRVISAGGDPRYRGLSGRLRYMISPLAILDFCAITPSFFLGESADSFVILRCARFAAFWFFGAMREAWDDIAESIRSRAYEFSLVIMFAFTILIVSAIAMYLAEGGAQPEDFGSIPRALWWSVATLTTIGYGDVVPVTPWGRVIAGLSALSAIGLIALPAGIFASSLSDAMQKRRKKRISSQKL